jgi:hypothetical protein
VLPQPDHLPTLTSEEAVRLTITTPIPSDLLVPPRRQALDVSAVPLATVPKTAIDEDGDACAREHEIGAPAERRYCTCVDPVSKTRCPDQTSENQLRPDIGVRR